MKPSITHITAFFCLLFLLQSCYDNPTFLEEHTTDGKGYYPVLSTASGYESQYKQGDDVTFTLQYFSQGEIESITLDELVATPDGDTTQSQVFSKDGDAGVLIDSLSTQTLQVSYTVPQVPDSTQITLKSKITNKNTLADSLSFTFLVVDE